LSDPGGSIELLRAKVPGSDSLVTLRVRDGRFVDPSSGARPTEVLDLDGGLVLPAFIEAHLHLDKALIGVGSASNLAEAIAESAEYKRTMTRDDLRARALSVIEREVLAGTTLIRVHTDVDPIIGLLGIEVLLELRAELSVLVELQIVAFPQEGVLRTPGTLSLLRAALELGADVLGGCLYNEEDVASSRRQLDELLALATEYAVPLDLHADLADDASDPRFLLAGYVAQRVMETGFPYRVTLGHVSSWAGLPPAELDALLVSVREAGVGVVALPATDMHLGGRRDAFAVRRGIAPVARIWAAGVDCACATNNVRNAFTPYGLSRPPSSSRRPGTSVRPKSSAACSTPSRGRRPRCSAASTTAPSPATPPTSSCCRAPTRSARSSTDRIAFTSSKLAAVWPAPAGRAGSARSTSTHATRGRPHDLSPTRARASRCSTSGPGKPRPGSLR
jgi:cytosine deaminase